jgi:hypothetical protein
MTATAPQRLILNGALRLSAEVLAAGSVALALRR